MATRFSGDGQGGAVGSLERVEVRVLGGLIEQLIDWLTPEGAAATAQVDASDEQGEARRLLASVGGHDEVPPNDPVSLRLLPDAYRDDPQASAEFRRYTQRDLRDGKLTAAREMAAALPRRGGAVHLDSEQAEVWLSVLNDLRLALGTVLEVTQDSYGEEDVLPEDSPRRADLSLYHWLGWLQGGLLEAVLAAC